jgi:hypothetical protein
MTYELEDMGLRDRPEPPRDDVFPASFMNEHGSLKSLDLDGELYNAYAKAKNYLAEVQMDRDVPPNQVAQVFNTISSILKEIVKMQTDLYDAERVKKLEAAMLKAIKVAPKEAQLAFLEEYEAILKGM